MERELCSKEKERTLSEKWNQLAQKVLERQQQVKELRAYLQRVSGELKEPVAESQRLTQMVQNRKNIVDFSLSRLEEVQREYDKLRNQVRRVEWELDQQTHN